MIKFLIKGRTAQAIAEYDADGLIEGLSIEGGNASARGWLLARIPATVDLMDAFREATAGTLHISEAPGNTSFSAFWELYAYKVGKKDKVIQLWQALSEADRVSCLKAIPKYNRWIAAKANMEKVYPQTFLAQRRWDNEFAG